jgi:hypothetical protein
MSAIELMKVIKQYEQMAPVEACERIADELPDDLARLVAEHMFPSDESAVAQLMHPKVKKALDLAEQLLTERARALFGHDDVPGQSGYAKWALAHAAVIDALAPDKTPANDSKLRRQKPRSPQL